MPEKRRATRKSVRIRVRFWRPGEPDRVHRGYTTNISSNGAFIQTDHPHPKGRRLQVEFTTERNGFVCEALVARAVKSAPELQSARPSGMGLRFLTVEELLAGFLPQSGDAAGATDQLSQAPRRVVPTKRSDTTEGRDEELAAPAASTSDPTPKKPGEIEVTTPHATRRHPAAPPPRKDTETSHPVDSGNGPSTTAPLTFRLSPPDLDVVRTLYQRQIKPGILTLPSRSDCRVGRPVRVELKTPPSALGQRILAFDGEVLECCAAASSEAATLRVEIRANSTALDFLERLLEIETSAT